ncbi:MAG: choice-of-anchor D domain-containing protein, partial [Candidatus Kapabacteria bacterium]|nr:choice-of-anchor D domain-containing protein [Candidatus Kapabacteria bacterium]
DGNSSNKAPLASEFFTDKLQIEYQGRKNLIEGSYFKPFAMFGPVNEYISKGLVQFCNINANPHGSDGTAPARSMRASVETFGLMDGSPSEPHDYYTEFIDMTNIYKYNDEIVKTDNLLGCHRKMEGAGKIVYWSIGFEILNYGYWHNILEIQDLLWRSIRWCYQDMLLPEPFLEFSHEPLEFDEVPVGGAKELDFEIINVGGDILEISELHYDDFNFAEASENYEIIEGGVTADDDPLKLAPLEKHKCRVRFTPTEQSMYEGGVEVWSNAVNGELLGMSMTGHGGKKIEQGPHMVVADTIYFGEVKLGQGVEFPVQFENIGTERLKITALEIVNTADNSFAFRHYKVPVWIDPQMLDTTIVIRFSGNQVQEYIGELRIVSNDADIPDHIIYLKAEATLDVGTPVLTVDQDAKLEFEDIEAGTKADKILVITNKGDAKLVIDKVELVGDAEFTLEDYNPEYTIELIKDRTRDLKVRFRPDEEGSYSSTMFLTSNDAENPVFEVAVTGTATGSSVKDGKAYSEDNSLVLSANPNPFLASSVITLNSTKAYAQNVKLYLIDMSGRKVMDIAESTYTFGTHTLSFSSLNLASGTYILVAESQESSAKLPIVINK